jgi:hypothetical protein
MKLRNFFLPHHETHKKAHLLSSKALLIYLIFFLALHMIFTTVPKYQPGILGVTSGVDQQELIRLTNEERKKKGLPEVTEDPRLNAAAMEKARNMFEENYWAHYSPSGKDPWGFIQAAGYKFSYAGENLARNFYTSNEVVQAWMNSPTHRDNIVNSHYSNIGIAVLEGTLNGQKTTLVVQEFGRPYQGLAAVPRSTTQQSTPAQASEPSIQPSAAPTQQGAPEEVAPLNAPVLVADANIQRTQGESVTPNFTLDPYLLTKTAGISLITLLTILVAFDLYIIRRKMVYRIATRHLPQMSVMSVAASTLWNSTPGSITQSAVSAFIGAGP